MVVANGVNVPYTISGTGTTVGDFVSLTFLEYNGTVNT